MESLYRKYRPLTFQSVVGQQHIVSTLENAVTEGRLSHAYLFCGPRGTGKTTMARILAKALLCDEAKDAAPGHGCLPDGDCPECQAIAEGTHPDVYELDAASRTGVDNVREEIVNSVGFAPVRGRYKVYIIDEVHMLTTAAFNALLKTLEEPPAHVVFVLCTTDPQKVLETILSRCQRFDFHRIANEDLVSRMRYICEQEDFSFDEEALEIVARHARGGMRDALSALEQLSTFGDGSVRTADAVSLLGETSSTVLARFAEGIAVRDVVGLFKLVKDQVEEGADLLELTRDLVAHLRDVYAVRVAGAASALVDGTPDEVAALGEEAARFETPDRLARCLTVLDDAALQMRDASDARLVLEISLTRLARPESDLTLEALAERLDQLERRLAAGVAAPVPARSDGADAPAPAAGHVPVPVAARAQAAAPAVTSAAVASAPVSAPKPASAPHPAPASTAAPAARPVSAPRPAARPAPVPAPAPRPIASPAQVAAAAAPATPAVADAGELQRKWSEVVRQVTVAQPSRGALLQSSRAQSDDGSTVTVGLPTGSGFALKMLARPDSHAIILPIVCAVFGSRQVEFVMGDVARSQDVGGAPAKAAAPTAALAPQQVRQAAPAPDPASAPAPHPAQLASPAPAARPAEPAPEPRPAAAASADQVSGPTVVPERDVDADRRAWENEQVPYDDAAIAVYQVDEEPPFDVPADTVAPTLDPSQSVPGPAAVSTVPAASSTDPAATPAPALAAQPVDPDAAQDPKAILGEIFGAGVVFKDS